MTNLVLPGFGREERVEECRSQWFTKPSTADRMVGLAGRIPTDWRILEPSAGAGALVRAIRKQTASATIHAVELDLHYAEMLSASLAHDERLLVEHANYLDRPAPDILYDLTVMNPPFERGQDGDHLAKAMAESIRVIALIRLNALAGVKRSEKVWRRVEAGPWRMQALRIFEEREDFVPGRAIGDRDEDTSAKADFCVVQMSRAEPGQAWAPSLTNVGWW